MKVRFLLMTLLLVASGVLVVVAALAQDDEVAPAPDELELLEWDGGALTVRLVPVNSEADRQFIVEWNAMIRAQAELYERASNGKLDEPDVIETEYGPVTVQETVSEGLPDGAVPVLASIEVEEIETPYGIVTEETQTFTSPGD